MARRENVKAAARAWMRELIEAGATRDQAGAELVALARSLAADGETEAASVVAEVGRQPDIRDALPAPEAGDEAILVKLSELEAAGTPPRQAGESPSASIPPGFVTSAPLAGKALLAEGPAKPRVGSRPLSPVPGQAAHIAERA